jgi:hypothetical protein
LEKAEIYDPPSIPVASATRAGLRDFMLVVRCQVSYLSWKCPLIYVKDIRPATGCIYRWLFWSMWSYDILKNQNLH